MADIGEVLERFRRGAEVVAVSVTGAAGAQLEYRPSAGAWSVKEILGHLGDAELIAGVRFRRVIAEENPPMFGYRQTAWVESLGHQERKLADLMQMFRTLRADNHALLKRLPADVFERVGTHDVDGVLTLLQLVESYNAHTEKHARQLQATRQAYKESRGA